MTCLVAPDAPRRVRLGALLPDLAPELDPGAALARLEDTGAHLRALWRRPPSAVERHVLALAWEARGEPYGEVEHVVALPDLPPELEGGPEAVLLARPPMAGGGPFGSSRASEAAGGKVLSRNVVVGQVPP